MGDTPPDCSPLNQERIELANFAGLGMPEIIALGRADFAYARAPLNSHKHPGILEITYLARGQQTFEVCGQKVILTGGDLFFIFPDEIHSTNGMPREKSLLYWMLLAVPGLNQTFLNFSQPETREIFNRLLNVKSRHFSGSPELKRILDELITIYTDKNLSLKPLYLRNRVVNFLLTVIFCAEQSEHAHKTQDILHVLSQIDRNINGRISAKFLSDRVGLSPSRLRSKFKEQTGIPLSEYILRRKIDKSMEYLDRHEFTITQIAHELGFSSSQYFATAFKRYTGQSPSEYSSTLIEQSLTEDRM